MSSRIDISRLRMVQIVSGDADSDVSEVCYDEGEVWKIENGFMMIRAIAFNLSGDSETEIAWEQVMPASDVREIIVFDFMSDAEIDRVAFGERDQSSSPIV